MKTIEKLLSIPHEIQGSTGKGDSFDLQYLSVILTDLTKHLEDTGNDRITVEKLQRAASLEQVTYQDLTSLTFKSSARIRAVKIMNG